MTTTIWAQGAIRQRDEAVLTALDHGVTVGDGVFETMSVHDGVAFALTRHLKRLGRSARGLGLTAPDPDVVREAIAETLAAAGPTVGRLRVTWTAGPGPLGSHRDSPAQAAAQGHVPTLVVVAGPATRTERVQLARVPWVRNERSPLVGLKTTSYAENVVAVAYAARRGATEAIFGNTTGALCEGASSNVFVERGEELLTPSLHTGCLGGITRELLLEWGEAAGLPVRVAEPDELPITVLDDVLKGRGHVAVTSTIRNVAPADLLDRTAIEPGPLSLRAQQLFQERAGDDLDP